jgi:hypothetical protein
MTECLRQTMNSGRLSRVLDLPLSLRNREVEIIVLPVQSETAETPVPNGGSAFGSLKKYANPTLTDQEKGAWERAVAEHYANR